MKHMSNVKMNDLHFLGLRETLEIVNPGLSWREICIKCLHGLVSKKWKGIGITVTFTYGSN